MTLTDHSKAVLDGSHSHGASVGGGEFVPESSRAARLTSFDPEAFGVPTGREEEWRFAALKDLKPLFGAAEGDAVAPWSVSDLPAGVTLEEIDRDAFVAGAAREPGDLLGAVAVAHASGIARLSVAPSTVVDEPITVTVKGSGEDVRHAMSVEVGENAEATVIVDRAGTATVGEFVSVVLGQNASLNLVLLQQWDDDAVHGGEVVASLGKDARLRGSVVTLGGKAVRLNSTVTLAGEGSSVDLFGLYFADQGQHFEHQVFVDHAAPNARSRVTYKGALAGASARTVWIGDVLIRKAAEGTDTYELNRNLVLTEGARADSVPNLEIETGEIEGAGHASATGRFDEEQTFYLRSRGISEEMARRLVVRGFFADLVHEIGVPSVEESLLKAIDIELEHVNELESADD